MFEYVLLAPQLPIDGRIPNEVVCVPDLAATYPQLESRTALREYPPPKTALPSYPTPSPRNPSKHG